MGKTDLEIPQAFFFVFPPGKGEDLPRKGGFGHYLEVGTDRNKPYSSQTVQRTLAGSSTHHSQTWREPGEMRGFMSIVVLTTD